MLLRRTNRISSPTLVLPLRPLVVMAFVLCCQAAPAEGDVAEQRQAWYWDSVVNIFFDNGGRPLAKDVPIDTLVSELASIPADMIQVGAYGGDGLSASFPWTGAADVNGFRPPDEWDTLAVWCEVAGRAGKRFHIYTNTYNGLAPEDLAAVNPQFQGGRYGQGYDTFMQDVDLPILNEALALYSPQGVWVDGSEALVYTDYRRQIADIVHLQDPANMMTFNHSWLNIICGWPDPRTPPSYVDTLSFDRRFSFDQSRSQGMFYSSFTGIPHDMMHCVDAPGQSYAELLSQGGLAMASGGSWLLWINEDNGTAVLAPLATARQAAQWAMLRKPALGKTRSANRTGVLISETEWAAIMGNMMNVYPYVDAVKATALSLQDQGFLTDIVNEETLVQGADRYGHVFVPDTPAGPPRLPAITEQTLDAMQARGAVIVRDAPAAPSGYTPDVQRLANAAGCVFALRRPVGSSRYIFHVVDLLNPTRTGLSCDLPLPAEPTHVQAYPPSVDVSHTWSGGRCTITLGEFEAHTALVFYFPTEIIFADSFEDVGDEDPLNAPDVGSWDPATDARGKIRNGTKSMLIYGPADWKQAYGIATAIQEPNAILRLEWKWAMEENDNTGAVYAPIAGLYASPAGSPVVRVRVTYTGAVPEPTTGDLQVNHAGDTWVDTGIDIPMAGPLPGNFRQWSMDYMVGASTAGLNIDGVVSDYSIPAVNPDAPVTGPGFHSGTAYSYTTLDDVVLTVTLDPKNCGDPGTVYLLADLDHNCCVNWRDFSIFAGQWLAGGCSDPTWCNGGDLNHSSDVDWPDLDAFALDWLKCTDPNQTL
jgi:hypothetical protein